MYWLQISIFMQSVLIMLKEMSRSADRSVDIVIDDAPAKCYCLHQGLKAQVSGLHILLWCSGMQMCLKE